MVNRHRGEVSVTLDGRRHTMVLTLGALAELEAAFDSESLDGLGARFASGHLSSRDLLAIVGAGLRGAGQPIDDAALAAMRPDGGLPALARAVADLLRVTFLGDEAAPSAAAGEADPGNR